MSYTLIASGSTASVVSPLHTGCAPVCSSSVGSAGQDCRHSAVTLQHFEASEECLASSGVALCGRRRHLRCQVPSGQVVRVLEEASDVHPKNEQVRLLGLIMDHWRH